MAANVYYAAATLHGYIAEPEEKLQWLTGFEPAGYAGDDDAGAALDKVPALIETVGALVMGSKTSSSASTARGPAASGRAGR